MWDTAGQERFRAMVPMYYRGAAAALIIIDCTQKYHYTADHAKRISRGKCTF